MHESGLPPADLPPLTRSVAACLAAILELDVAAVPSPPADHPEPWTVWRNWLGGRGLGLVPVLEPGRFSWPGPWLALLQSATDGLVAAVAFGSPPGLVWTPLGGAEPFEAVELGYVVAPADVALWAPATTASASTGGHVEALLVAREAEGPLVPVAEAVAHAGRGLEGDRYHEGRGTFSNVHARGVDLTLVAAESLEALPLLPGGALAPQAARRNVVTRGVDLDALVGRPFLLGEVRCLGQRACEPCAHLQRLAGPGTLRALVHRGGLRADVCSDGVIRVGDPVVAL